MDYPDAAREITVLLTDRIEAEVAKITQRRHDGREPGSDSNREYKARDVDLEDGKYWVCQQDLDPSSDSLAERGSPEFVVDVALRGLDDPVRTAGLVYRRSGDQNVVLDEYSASVAGGNIALDERSFVTVARMGGDDTSDMDGFTGISKQVIRVSPFSCSTLTMSDMANAIFELLGRNNFVGRVRDTYIQSMRLDTAIDVAEEEASLYGRDMFWMVIISPMVAQP